MKKLLLFTFILVSTLGISRAEERTEKRNTNPFSEVSLRVNADLYIEQGDEQSVQITASDEALNKIIVEVNDDKLIIRFSWEDMLFHDFNPGHMEIRVVTKNIYALTVQGSGTIYAEKPIETHSLELNIAGSGDIKLSQVNCDKIDATVTGSGDIVIDGPSKGREIEILIAGSGDVEAADFESEVAYVKIAGSGDCDVNVSEFLDVNIYGSGDVKYQGEPNIKSKVAGSGRVYKK